MPNTLVQVEHVPVTHMHWDEEENIGPDRSKQQPVIYSPHRNKIYVGDEGTHHSELLATIHGNENPISVGLNPDDWNSGEIGIGGPLDHSGLKYGLIVPGMVNPEERKFSQWGQWDPEHINALHAAGLLTHPHQPDINWNFSKAGGSKIANEPPTIEELKHEHLWDQEGEGNGERWLGDRQPFIYYPHENHVVVGPRGTYHSQLDSDTYNEMNPQDMAMGAILHPTNIGKWNKPIVKSLGDVPNHVLHALSEKYGIPAETSDDQWNLSHKLLSYRSNKPQIPLHSRDNVTNGSNATDDPLNKTWYSNAQQNEPDSPNPQKGNEWFPVLDEFSHSGSLAHPFKPWQLGTYGKGILTRGNELHHWQVDDRGFGRPHHTEGIQDLNIRDPEAYMYFEPDGTFGTEAVHSNDSQEKADEWDDRILKLEPQAKLPGQWDFTSSSEPFWNLLSASESEGVYSPTLHITLPKMASSWDPLVCEQCGGTMTEPMKMGQSWTNHCTRCGRTRQVPSNSPMLQQKILQDQIQPYPDLLNQVGPERGWTFSNERKDNGILQSSMVDNHEMVSNQSNMASSEEVSTSNSELDSPKITWLDDTPPKYAHKESVEMPWGQDFDDWQETKPEYNAPGNQLGYDPSVHREGKGFLMNDGSLWTWPTQNLRPMHMEYSKKLKRLGLQPEQAIHIGPQGEIWQYGEGRDLDLNHKKQIQAADPRLNFADDNWALSKTAWEMVDDGLVVPNEGDTVDGTQVVEVDNLTTHLEDGRALALDQVHHLEPTKASEPEDNSQKLLEMQAAITQLTNTLMQPQEKKPRKLVINRDEHGKMSSIEEVK